MNFGLGLGLALGLRLRFEGSRVREIDSFLNNFSIDIKTFKATTANTLWKEGIFYFNLNNSVSNHSEDSKLQRQPSGFKESICTF